MMRQMPQRKINRQKMQEGFITMIVMMLVILAAVIYVAYKRVTSS